MEKKRRTHREAYPDIIMRGKINDDQLVDEVILNVVGELVNGVVQEGLEQAVEAQTDEPMNELTDDLIVEPTDEPMNELTDDLIVEPTEAQPTDDLTDEPTDDLTEVQPTDKTEYQDLTRTIGEDVEERINRILAMETIPAPQLKIFCQLAFLISYPLESNKMYHMAHIDPRKRVELWNVFDEYHLILSMETRAGSHPEFQNVLLEVLDILTIPSKMTDEQIDDLISIAENYPWFNLTIQLGILRECRISEGLVCDLFDFSEREVVESLSYQMPYCDRINMSWKNDHGWRSFWNVFFTV